MRTWTLLAPLLVAACAPQVETSAIMLRPPSPPVHRVEVYVAGQAPPRHFYEVGIVQAEAFGSEPSPEDLVKGLSRRAGELGCEALLRVQIDLGYTRGHASGTCVRWLEAAPANTPPPSPPRFEAPSRAVPPAQETPAPRPNEPSPSTMSPGTSP